MPPPLRPVCSHSLVHRPYCLQPGEFTDRIILLRRCRKIVFLTASQAFTLAASIKAEKLNSAIEKRHWITSNGFEQASFTGAVKAARMAASGAHSIGETGRASTS